MKKLLFIAVIATMFAGCASDDDVTGDPTPVLPPADAWTTLGFDASSHFHNRAEAKLSVENAATLVETWQFKTAGSVTGVPAIVDGVVYTVSGGATYALDADTGDVIWQNNIKGTSAPTWHAAKLYINDSRAMLHRLDAATGDEEWQAPIDEAHTGASGFSSPVIAGDLVLVGSASFEEAQPEPDEMFRGAMIAFDIATGREAWRHYTVDLPANGVAIWSSASVDFELGLVFGSTGNNYTGDASPTSDSIFALDLKTGDLRWNRQLTEGDVFTIGVSTSPDADFGTNPIVFDAEIDGTVRKLVGAGQKSGVFWVLDRETGEVVWQRAVSGGSSLIGGIFNNGAYDGERIIVAGNTGVSTGPGSVPANGNSSTLGPAKATSVLAALDPADGTVLWERQLGAWVWAPITIANGVGFVAVDRVMQAFNVVTGEKLFEFATEGTIASGAAIVGGRVFFGSGLSYFGTKGDTTFHALELPE